MIDVLYAWRDELRATFDLTLLQWPLLLALAAAAGHLVQRRAGLPQVVGYSVVGAIAGLAGFSGAVWPLEGTGLLLLQLGVAVVLFEAGGRIALRWFRHNPMVLLQSLLESALTFAFVYYTMRWLGLAATASEALAAIAMAGSPALLARVVRDTGATGAVTERALALTTLGTLYALALVSARTHVLQHARLTPGETLWPVLIVLGLSVVVGLGLALALRAALRVMSPDSENTSIVLICGIAAGAALVDDLGGSAPLAALLGGLFRKQMHPRPWSWPNQLGTAASLLVVLNFVLVAVVAAQAPWNPAVAGGVLALLGARVAAKVLGVSLANAGSGLGWRQALWTACAMSPMASVALLLVSQFAAAAPRQGPAVASVALPAILLMEVVGAIVATFALYRAGEGAHGAASVRGPHG